MKKNILTVVIMALCLMNVILSAVIVFSIVPMANNTNKLIEQVASAVKLDLTDGSASAYDVAKLEDYKIEQAITKNLKIGTDGKSHYAKMDYVSLSVNTDSEDYSSLNDTLISNKQDSKIMDIVGGVFSQYTYEEAMEDDSVIREEVMSELKKYFGSADFIIDISFGNLVYA